MNFLPQGIPFHWCIVAGVIVFLLAFVAVREYLNRRRRLAIRDAAEDLGLTSYANIDELERGEGPNVAEFLQVQQMLLNCQITLNHEFTNIMFAYSDGLLIFVADHSSELYKSEKIRLFPIQQTIVAILSPYLDVPRFHLSVKSMLKAGFYEDFASGVLDYLEAHPKTTVAGRAQSVVVYEPEKRCKPGEYRDLVGRGFEIHEILKNEYPVATPPMEEPRVSPYTMTE